MCWQRRASLAVPEAKQTCGKRGSTWRGQSHPVWQTDYNPLCVQSNTHAGWKLCDSRKSESSDKNGGGYVWNYTQMPPNFNTLSTNGLNVRFLHPQIGNTREGSS